MNTRRIRDALVESLEQIMLGPPAHPVPLARVYRFPVLPELRVFPCAEISIDSGGEKAIATFGRGIAEGAQIWAIKVYVRGDDPYGQLADLLDSVQQVCLDDEGPLQSATSESGRSIVHDCRFDWEGESLTAEEIANGEAVQTIRVTVLFDHEADST